MGQRQFRQTSARASRGGMVASWQGRVGDILLELLAERFAAQSWSLRMTVPHQATIPPASSGGEHHASVLIVAPDVGTSQVLAAVLRQSGHHSRVVGTPQEAVRALRGENADLVLA